MNAVRFLHDTSVLAKETGSSTGAERRERIAREDYDVLPDTVPEAGDHPRADTPPGEAAMAEFGFEPFRDRAHELDPAPVGGGERDARAARDAAGGLLDGR